MVIQPTQWRPQPWKNGRGVTSEVLRVPDREDYEVRVSVAEVTAPGPFSTFPGYRRATTLLGGGPIALVIDGVVRPLARGVLVDFAGEAACEAREVAAPAHLLNVLVRPGVRVGIGATAAADIAFDLATHATRVFDAPAPVAGDVVWIRR